MSTSSGSPMGSSSASSQGRITGLNNPYKAKRQWPPDFSKMDPKYQFRLERRYRRRTKLAYMRPGWQRKVKLVQYTTVTLVAGYGVLFMDWGDMGKPFDGLRTWVKDKANSIWTTTTTTKEPPRPHIGKISAMEKNDA